MPPNDYAPYKSVVPNSGIATASPVTPVSTPEYTPEELAYLQQQRAAAEPWSAYLGSVASNAVNTGRAFLPTFLGGEGSVGISDIAKGAVEGAVSGATLPGDALAGRVQVFDPRTGQPTEEVLRRGADFTGTVTLGAGAVPAQANTLRMGAQVVPVRSHPNNPAGSSRRAEVRDNNLYSKAEDLLAGYQQKTGTVDQFVKYLEKNGVKKPEIEIMTRNLAMDQKVTTDELIQNIMANEPRTVIQTTPYFEEYTMPGGTDYRMMNIRWSNPDATYGMHPFRHQPHHLPDNTLAHARLKNDVYTGADGTAKKVLRVEELQSDWAQNTKGKWALPASPDRITVRTVPLDKVEETLLEARKSEIAKNSNLEQPYRNLARALVNSAQTEGHDTFSFYRVNGVESNEWQEAGAGKKTPEELYMDEGFMQQLDDEGERAEPMDPVQEMLYNERFGKSPAPYVAQGSAGWLPLATKHLLVEAAKNGQDEIVIAPGKVHANRWAANEPERAKGLEAFYDEIAPKEINKALKEVEKDSGVKGLKIEMEERPFVDVGGKNKYTPEYRADLWLNEVHKNPELAAEVGFGPPPQPNRADYDDPVEYRRAVSRWDEDWANYTDTLDTVAKHFTTLQYKIERGMSFEESVADTGNDLKNRVETEEQLVNDFQEQLNKLEEIPYNQLDREDETRIDDLFAKLEQHKGYKDYYTRELQDLETSSRLYRYWMDNVQTKGDNKKAMVIKLTPDLREFILKNGLPRFAKGGIVDLVEKAAYA